MRIPCRVRRRGIRRAGRRAGVVRERRRRRVQRQLRAVVNRCGYSRIAGRYSAQVSAQEDAEAARRADSEDDGESDAPQRRLAISGAPKGGERGREGGGGGSGGGGGALDGRGLLRERESLPALTRGAGEGGGRGGGLLSDHGGLGSGGVPQVGGGQEREPQGSWAPPVPWKAGEEEGSSGQPAEYWQQLFWEAVRLQDEVKVMRVFFGGVYWISFLEGSEGGEDGGGGAAAAQISLFAIRRGRGKGILFGVDICGEEGHASDTSGNNNYVCSPMSSRRMLHGSNDACR